MRPNKTEVDGKRHSPMTAKAFASISGPRGGGAVAANRDAAMVLEVVGVARRRNNVCHFSWTMGNPWSAPGNGKSTTAPPKWPAKDPILV